MHVTPADDIRPIDPTDLSSCVNAGWRPTLDECNLDGQTQQRPPSVRKAGLEATTVTIAASTDATRPPQRVTPCLPSKVAAGPSPDRRPHQPLDATGDRDRALVGTPTGYEGRAVCDTDTGTLMVCASPTTGWKPPWNLPWGYVGRAQRHREHGRHHRRGHRALDLQRRGGSPVPCRWRADFNQSVGTDLATAHLTDGPAGIAGTPGVQGRRQLRDVRRSPVPSGLSGSTTLKLRAECSVAGTIVVAGSIFQAELVITDIGPSGAPA